MRTRIKIKRKYVQFRKNKQNCSLLSSIKQRSYLDTNNWLHLYTDICIKGTRLHRSSDYVRGSVQCKRLGGMRYVKLIVFQNIISYWDQQNYSSYSIVDLIHKYLIDTQADNHPGIINIKITFSIEVLYGIIYNECTDIV